MLAMKLRMHFLGYIILFGFNALVRGQFEDLRGCLTHKKFPAMMVRSFASKFFNMIGLNEAHRYATLDNIDFKNAFDTVDQTNFIADLIRFGHPSHWEYNNFDDFTLTDIFSKLQENSNPDESLFEQMKRKKLNPQLKQFLTPVIDQLSLVKDRLNQIQDALNNPSDTHGNVGSFRSNEHLTELERIAKCFEGHTDEEFEDGISWVKCLYICKDLPLLSQAVAEVFAQIPECSRVPWLGDMILRVFVDFMELNTCFFEIVSPTPDAWPLQLPEGDPQEKFIEFRTYLPPGVHCFPPEVLSRKIRLGIDVIKLVFGLKKSCDVQIELSTSNYMQDALPYVRIPRVNATLGRPRCRNRTAINQAAIGWHDNAINASGIIPLSETNWNSTFRIPIAAVVDHKVEEDPFHDVNFTMKMVADGSRLNTTKIPMRVYDMDSRSQSVCQSVNDPHVVTFDNLYYNNLLQGYFVLYRNDFLPYEVQVIYQSCGSSTRGESCNCGVAVKSGDDVFVIDRCRLKNDSCTGDTCRVLKATLYVNGELTNGTRIFRLDGGLSYQVILPHGTLVKIKANGEEFLNVWVTPSPYDRNHTSGLCGTFNDQSSDDLAHPNNSRTDDATNAKDSPPIQFIQSWRVPAENRLFDGARPSNESFITNDFCLCSHLLIRGIECLCGYDKLVQTCDLELGDEFNSHNITAITKESQKYYNDVVFDDKRDVNESYIPIGSQSNYSDWQALQHCMTLLRPSNTHLLYQCNMLSLFPIPKSFPSRDFDLVKQLMKNPIANAIYGCLDDVKITGRTDVLEWQLSALDAAKESCRMMIDRSTRVGERLVRRYENETCINNCYGRGVCAYGTCICNQGYTSSDCSQSTVRPPPILVMESRSLCDSRFDDCSFATIHGKNFTEDNHLACRIQPFKSKYTDVVTSTQAFDVSTWLININQIACLLPTSQSSYKISLMTSEGVTAGMFSFYVYDSVCFVCNPDRELCERKPDQSYCIIDNECFANMQRSSTDECRICNVSSSLDALYDSQEVKCVERREAEKKRQDDHRKEWTIRIAVSVSASALIILAAIILFIRERTQLRKLEKKKKEQGEGGTSNGGVPEKARSNELDPKKLSDVINQNHLPAIDIGDSHVIYDNKAFVKDDAESGFHETECKEHIESPHENNSTENAKEISLTSEANPAYPAAIKNLDLLRVKADVPNGSRSRKESMSSVKSASRVHQLIHEHHLDRRPSNASVGSYGIGGSGPLLFGCHRRMSQVCNPDAHDDEENFGIGGHGMPTIPSFSSGIEAPEYEQL